MTVPARIFAVVPAAGVGRRMNGGKPKQYLMLNGKTVLEHSLEKLLLEPRIQKIIVVLSADDKYWQSLQIFKNSRIEVVTGGSERCISVLNGMQHLFTGSIQSVSGDRGRAGGHTQRSRDFDDSWSDSWVLVHDVARPCIRLSDIQKLIAALQDHPVGGILAVPVVDTLKKIGSDQYIETTVDRDDLWQAQTPQMFPCDMLLNALKDSVEKGFVITDEASAMEFAGFSPLVVEGSPENIKITRREDLALAEYYLSKGLM
jgi:2-C-methyl-D-erythritol 4-phosphate cytidylyltransferase